MWAVSECVVGEEMVKSFKMFISLLLRTQTSHFHG